MLVLANDHVKLPGKKGKGVRMSDAVNDMFAFTHLTDDILSVIQMSTSSALAPARAILEDVNRRYHTIADAGWLLNRHRRLYKFVGQTQSHFAKVTRKQNLKRVCHLRPGFDRS